MADGRGFQYPIPTYSITKDFDWSDTENNRLLFEMTAKYGTPYFSNYINSDMEREMFVPCAALASAGPAGTAEKIRRLFRIRRKYGIRRGSYDQHAKVDYLSADEQDFYRRLDHMMDIAGPFSEDQTGDHYKASE